MKPRPGIQSVRAGLATAALLLAFAAVSVPVYGDTSGQAAPSDYALTLTWQPVVIYNLTMPSIVMKYYNAQTTPVNGTLYADVRNVAGQTVYIASVPLGIVNGSASVTTILPMPLPVDSYTTTVFVVDSTYGFALSTTNSTSVIT